MLRKILFVILVYFFSVELTAQQLADIQTPKIVPPSPDAAALGKYGQIPVDKSTGIPQISIPLYEIKTPRFSLPISLSYHASGIKVEEISSWIGTGWSLNAGGVITRSIAGMPDDAPLGFLNSTLKKASSIVWPNDIYYIADVLNKRLDTDPDNFFYNFTGHSGAFVFGDDKKPVITPYSPIKMKFNRTSKNFDITDEQGNIFSFSDKEYVSSSISNMSGISSWYLTQMVSADLTDTVKFIYTTDGTTQTQFSYNFSQSLTSPDGFSDVALQQLLKGSTINQFNTLRISSILFKGGKVNFISKGGRLDDGIMSLDSMIVFSSNPVTNGYVRIKSFKLLQNYFYSSVGIPSGYFITVAESNKYRLKLTAVQENDATNNAIKTYQFDYNSGVLPNINSCAQDYWGFYNGKWANQTLLESHQVTYLPNYWATTQQVAVIGGSDAGDRSVSENDMKAGVLEKITYPTKGYTSFIYECNKKTDVTYSQINFNVSAIGAQNQGGTQEINTQTYTPTPAMLSSGGNVFTVKLATGNTPSGATLPYVKIVRVSDGVVIYNSASNGSANTTITNLVLSLDPNVQYAITAEAHGNSYPPTSQSSYAMIFTDYTIPTGTALTNMGGLRVKSIKSYNSDGTLTNTESYYYGSNDESGTGVQLAFYPIWHYVIGNYYAYNNGQSCGVSPWTANNIYTNNSFYPLSTFNGSPVAYPTVKVYYGDSLQNKGKTIYQYDTYPDDPFVVWSYSGYGSSVKPISVSWKNGEPKWEGHYRNDGNNHYTLMQETSNNYSIIERNGGVGSKLGYVAEPVGFHFDNPSIEPNTHQVTTSGPCGGVYWLSNHFYWYDYPISTGCRLLTQKSTTTYSADGSSPVTETTNYTYDSLDHLQPIVITNTNSKGESFKKQIKYPFDYPSTEPYSTMVTRNIITPVIEQLTFKGTDNTPFQSTRTNYNFWNGTAWSSYANIIVPQTLDTKTSPQISYETRLRYLSYDDRGNITTVSKENDVKKTYLWGYNKIYPVAEITGTDYATASAYINQNILDKPTDDVTLRTQLNNLRSIPNTLVTTYTYRPLVGMTSATDVNGRTNYYIYDAFGRLDHIKDKDGNIVKKFCYNYLGQPGACGIYANTVQYGTYTKACTGGYSGSQVTYTVPANTYYASTQTDANTLALNDVNANGQAYADANGTCSIPPITVTGNSYIGAIYTVRFTNVSTGLIYYMYLYPNSSGNTQMPPGTYNINFYPYTGNTVYTTFYVNYYSSSGYGANFYNISIGSGSWVRIGQ
jgi:hypothetical protein